MASEEKVMTSPQRSILSFVNYDGNSKYVHDVENKEHRVLLEYFVGSVVLEAMKAQYEIEAGYIMVPGEYYTPTLLHTRAERVRALAYGEEKGLQYLDDLRGMTAADIAAEPLSAVYQNINIARLKGVDPKIIVETYNSAMVKCLSHLHDISVNIGNPNILQLFRLENVHELLNTYKDLPESVRQRLALLGVCAPVFEAHHPDSKVPSSEHLKLSGLVFGNKYEKAFKGEPPQEGAVRFPLGANFLAVTNYGSFAITVGAPDDDHFATRDIFEAGTGNRTFVLSQFSGILTGLEERITTNPNLHLTRPMKYLDANLSNKAFAKTVSILQKVLFPTVFQTQ